MSENRVLVGVPRETYPGETRVALVPTVLPTLTKAGISVVLETGAGTAAGFPDDLYQEHGATIGSRADAFGADVVVQVRTFGSNPEADAPIWT